MSCLTTGRSLSIVAVAASFFLSFASRGAANQVAEEDNRDNRTFLLTIDALHTLSSDRLHQEIVIEEGRTFFVATRVDNIRWTFSGRVGHVVNGKLPLMMKSQWYESPKSNETLESPRLLDIDGKSGPLVAPIHGHGTSLTIRETTATRVFTVSEVMENALRRMIQELQESQDESRSSSK